MTYWCRNFARRFFLHLLPSNARGLASYRFVRMRLRGSGGIAALLVFLLLPAGTGVCAGTPQQARVPSRRGLVQLEADRQRKEGNTFYADGNVDIRYGTMRLRADHARYNDATGEARVDGHVRFDTESQSLEAESGSYNMRTSQGAFHRVTGSVRAVRLANRNVLVSQNPFLFSAREVRRVNQQTYEIYNAWITVCPADRPAWKFYARRASIRVNRNARLYSASFRLGGVPILYLPYASVPVGKHLRQSGFLVPEIGQSTLKGFIFGDAFYWAPVSWFDATLNGELFSRRGPALIVDLRAKPAENFSASYHFFGVHDRGLPGPGGIRVPQGGHESRFTLDAELAHGWRAVADVNTLSSLTFRLAFASTFAEAVNAEVASTAFLTNHFDGFSLNFAASGYKNYFSTSPQTAIVLRTAPEVRLDSVDLAPWKWPVYLGIDTYADGVSRSDPGLDTPALVQRTELAPRVTVPLRWGPWIGLTSTFALRVTRYGAQNSGGALLDESIVRKTAEATVDLRPPSFERIYGEGDSRWKHVIEPEVTYRYVTGVNDFAGILRFDEYDTLTDTNEVEYSVTQRLFHGTPNGTDEVASWTVSQKYYFDPTFGGALVPGQRNVFQAVDSLSPFAFADGVRRFSPVTSDFRLSPGGRYELELLQDFDTQKNQLLATGTVLKFRPYRESFLTLAHFLTHGDTLLQPRSDQIRFQAGYGEVNRPGFNLTTGMSYDFLNHFIQNQSVIASYNGSCCGLAFEFRRLALGSVRQENQFRVAFLIANLGTVGNVRRQEKLF
ncbi:MAG TPA: LPS assembly protein LptD [Candidatus Acidoferrales bacterium]|nr:LPS assembly protein LptD [Candidatus Acidoferrales bacterium]